LCRCCVPIFFIVLLVVLLIDIFRRYYCWRDTLVWYIGGIRVRSWWYILGDVDELIHVMVVMETFCSVDTGITLLRPGWLLMTGIWSELFCVCLHCWPCCWSTTGSSVIGWILVRLLLFSVYMIHSLLEAEAGRLLLLLLTVVVTVELH
jgi:hypothetical protein